MSTQAFLEKYPQYEDFITAKWSKVYRRYVGDELVEQWQKDTKGEWHDVTERVLEEIRIRQEMADIEKRLNYVQSRKQTTVGTH